MFKKHSGSSMWSIKYRKNEHSSSYSENIYKLSNEAKKIVSVHDKENPHAYS